MQKCTKFENSLFHCILRSPSERSLKVLYSFRSCCCLFLCSIPVSFFVIQQKNFRRRSGSNLWWWVPLKQSPRPLDYHSLGQSCYGLFLLIYNLLLLSIPLFYVFEQKKLSPSLGIRRGEWVWWLKHRWDRSAYSKTGDSTQNVPKFNCYEDITLL